MKQAPAGRIPVLDTTVQLAEFCRRAANHPYVAVDTEFMGEGRYQPLLCLIQLAMPGDDDGCAVTVDPLAEGMCLDPLKEIFGDTGIVKVFHAARQDLAIFFNMFGSLPEPVFDTQLAAMVCGYGQNAGYEALVQSIAGRQLNKSARLHDWSRRPLSRELLRYALDDVTHLRVIYEGLTQRLNQTNRTHWIQDELESLVNPEHYRLDPREAWKRTKKIKNGGKFLSVLREIAAYREIEACRQNKPRNQILSDELMVQFAEAKPQTTKQLFQSRMFMKSRRRDELAKGIITAVKAGLAVPKSEWPKLPNRSAQPANPAAFELMRVLLKIRSSELGVAEQVIATSDELKRLAAGNSDVKQLRGWRREVFGNDALRLGNGETAIAVNGNSLVIVDSS